MSAPNNSKREPLTSFHQHNRGFNEEALQDNNYWHFISEKFSGWIFLSEESKKPINFEGSGFEHFNLCEKAEKPKKE